MKPAQVFLFVSAMSVLSAAPAPADDYPVTSNPLYPAMGVMTRLTPSRGGRRGRRRLGSAPSDPRQSRSNDEPG